MFREREERPELVPPTCMPMVDGTCNLLVYKSTLHQLNHQARALWKNLKQQSPSFIPVLPNKMELLTETFSTIRPSARSSMRVMIISLSYTQTCMHPKCKPLGSPWLSMATALPQCHAFPPGVSHRLCPSPLFLPYFPLTVPHPSPTSPQIGPLLCFSLLSPGPLRTSFCNFTASENWGRYANGTVLSRARKEPVLNDLG